MQPTDRPEDVLPQSELTRLGSLYSWQSILFIALTLLGLGAGIYYIFGFTWNGERLLEGEYYWIFIGLFAAASFIAMPARPPR